MRPEIDLARMLDDVIGPVLVELARPGEVEGVLFEWGPERGPASGDTPGQPLELRLIIVMCGEAFHATPWTVGQPPLAGEDARPWLRSQLQDFIAESEFGWGELRGASERSP